MELLSVCAQRNCPAEMTPLGGMFTSANLAVPERAIVPKLESRSSLVIPTPVSLFSRSP